MHKLFVLRAAFKDRWKLIGIVFLVVTLSATAGVYLRRPVYESRAAVLVNVERLGVSVSRADVRQDVAVLQAVEAVTSQAEVLRSGDLIERAINTLDPAVFRARPARNPLVAMIVKTVGDVREFFSDILRELRLLPPRNERYDLVREIEGNLSISPVRQAQVIRLGFAAHSPETAQLVLQRLLDLYVGHAADNTLEVEGSGMLLRQATAVRGELDDAERELFALRSSHDIADLAAEKSAMIERINRLTTVIEGVTDVLQPSTAGAARTAAVERSVIEVPANDAVSSSVGTQVVQLRTQLNALRVTRAGLLADLSTEHPRLRSLDQQIASTEVLLRKEVSALKDTISGYRARLKTLTAVEPQLQRLQRNAAILSESYDVYRKAAEDRRLMREQEARLQIQIVDPPSLPYAPRGPVPILLVAGGALLGLLSGVGLAILLTFLRGPVVPAAQTAQAAQAPQAAPKEQKDPPEPKEPVVLEAS